MTDELAASRSVESVAGKGIVCHPFFSHTTLLRTKPSDELYLAIKRAIILREDGNVFTGPSRVGKSDALDRVKTMLNQEYPTLCIYSHAAHNQQMPSIRAFFKHFLSTVEHVNKKGETFDLRERLVKVFVDDARMSGLNMVVLFVDEASAMMIEDFLFLKDIYNDLNGLKCQLITILMGQSPDMQNVVDDLIARGRGDLMERFARRIRELRGFNSLGDIQMIFSGMDTREYPVGSGVVWTAFFFPQAHKTGFRMLDQSQAFFNAISANGNGLTLSFPAGATFLAIRVFLLIASGYDAPDMALPETLWSEAVTDAMLAEAMARTNHRSAGRAKKGKK